jgi:two-component system sensor histidine kinase AlgZ
MMMRDRERAGMPVSQPAAYADTFLPDFCEDGNLLRTMLIAELLAIGVAVVESGSWLARTETLALTSLFVQWVAIVDIAVLCACQRQLARLDDRVAAGVAFVGLQLVTLGFTGIVALAQNEPGLRLSERSLATMAFQHGVVSAIVTGLALRYFYVSAQWRRQVQAEANARVQALQARIRPHFLFNSMNTIAQLTRAEPAQAESAVEDLSQLFRVSLSERRLIRLEDELAMVASYLRLERQRLGERLQVDWSVAPDTGAAQIPPLTLQPLVENAVYHGIARLSAGGRIAIGVERCQDGRVRIAVRNPMPADAARASGHAMAQANVGQRLRLALGERARLDTRVEGDDYVVSVTVPGETL